VTEDPIQTEPSENPEPAMRDLPSREPGSGRRVPIVIGGAVVAVVLLGALLLWRADAKTNKVELSARPKPVTVVEAKASTFRPARTYIGTLAPWVEAKIGPQLVSAFVDTVLVRPGAIVKRGEVLATLDCRNTNAASQAVAMEARALDARLKAISSEAARFHGLLDGGFVAANDAEQKEAQSAAQAAEVSAQKAKLAGTSLEVSDCILRAPFDGEIATRTIDPGAFVRPGTAIVSIVDRSTVRLTGDAPEIDFAVVAPETPVRVHLLATNKDVIGRITRRAPRADEGTRTISFEIDLSDPTHEIPVGTTGEIAIDVGEPMAATEIPLFAASVRGPKAVVYVVENGIAHSKTFAVKGESGGSLFLETTLAPGSKIVSEGRALLQDGDRVEAKDATPASVASASPTAAPGGPVVPATAHPEQKK
jgi:RND family efflux transporter MFP subunit